MSERSLVRWRLPAVGSSEPATRTPGSAAELGELREAARREGYEAGRREGLAAGQEQISTQVARLDALMQTLAEPLRDLDECVERQLVELTVSMVKLLIRRELRIDPTHIIGVVRDAVGALPLGASHVSVHLHPEDAELVRQSLADSHGRRAWHFVEDPLMARGDCRVVTDTSQVDATLNARLDHILRDLLGEDMRREGD